MMYKMAGHMYHVTTRHVTMRVQLEYLFYFRNRYGQKDVALKSASYVDLIMRRYGFSSNLGLCTIFLSACENIKDLLLRQLVQLQFRGFELMKIVSNLDNRFKFFRVVQNMQNL